VSVGDHNGEFRLKATNLMEKSIPRRAFRNEDSEPFLFRHLPYRRRGESPPPPRGAIRLRDNPHDIVTFLVQGTEGWQGKQRRPPE
jgi:hypothetical protein